jgi:hypothetical protein
MRFHLPWRIFNALTPKIPAPVVWLLPVGGAVLGNIMGPTGRAGYGHHRFDSRFMTMA